MAEVVSKLTTGVTDALILAATWALRVVLALSSLGVVSLSFRGAL